MMATTCNRDMAPVYHRFKDGGSSPSSSTSSVPEDVVKKTRAVLLSCTKGVLLKRFANDYFRLSGEPFPWKRLGYANMLSLLQAMPEAVHLEYSRRDNDHKLHGVGDSKSFFMPSWVLKTQEKIQRRRSLSPSVSPRRRSPSQHFADGSPDMCGKRHSNELIYNLKGLVTLHVKWKAGSKSPHAQQRNLTVINKVIQEHFSTVETPTEVFVRGNDSPLSSGIAFVRFDEISKARNVLQLLHGSSYQGIMFQIVPAKDRIAGGERSKNNSRPQSPNGPIRTTENNSRPQSPNGPIRTAENNSRPLSPNGPIRTAEKCTSQQLSNRLSPHQNISNGIKSSNRNGRSMSCDSHVTKKNDRHDVRVQNRFRHLIDELRVDERSDSEESSLTEYSEWEKILGPIPSLSQIVSHSGIQTPASPNGNHATSSRESVSRDPPPHQNEHVYSRDSEELYVSSSNGSHDQIQQHVSCGSHDHTQGWDVAPVVLSGPSPPNKYGLVRAHVSEVVSPDLIWLQLSCDLERDLNTVSTIIANNEPQPLSEINIGNFCCIRESSSCNENVLYRRAKIESSRDSPIRILRQATVSLIDSGVERKAVPLDDLLELPVMAQPSSIPPLATPCSLHGIECINEGEGWFPLDIQLLWKHLYHKQVYAKEVFIPRPVHSTPPTKSKTTAVKLYFDPKGTVSVVDVLVMEGMRIDYSQPLTSFESDDDSVASDNGHARPKKRGTNVLDLPTVTRSCFDDDTPHVEDPLPDEDDSLVSQCADEISLKFSIGPKKSSVGEVIQSQPSYWEQLQMFCDTLTAQD